VRSATLDGRVIDTSRFRRSTDDWAFSFSAPPDSGFVLAFTLVPAAKTGMELTSMMAGLPATPGVTIPARTRGTIINQTGDVTVLRRSNEFQPREECVGSDRGQHNRRDRDAGHTDHERQSAGDMGPDVGDRSRGQSPCWTRGWRSRTLTP